MFKTFRHKDKAHLIHTDNIRKENALSDEAGSNKCWQMAAINVSNVILNWTKLFSHF